MGGQWHKLHQNRCEKHFKILWSSGCGWYILELMYHNIYVVFFNVIAHKCKVYNKHTQKIL